MRILGTALLIASALLLCGTVPAAETELESEEKFRRNHIGLFAGGTVGGESSGDGREPLTATIGFGYQRKLSRLIGIGLLGEFTSGERRDLLWIAPLTFKPVAGAEFTLGFGWERSNDNSGSNSELQGLVRIGFGYEFEVLPRQTVTPEINLDTVDGETLLVFGVTVGWDL